jgi:transposase
MSDHGIASINAKHDLKLRRSAYTTAACGRGGPFVKLWGMKAYSRDLRIRVMDAVDRGMPQAEVSRLFRVSVRSIKRWRHRQRERGHLGESPRPGRTGRKLAALRAGLLPHLEAHPDATLEELCQWWEETHKVRVSHATMSRVITRHFGWTRKKVDPSSGAQRGEAGCLARANPRGRARAVRLD